MFRVCAIPTSSNHNVNMKMQYHRVYLKFTLFVGTINTIPTWWFKSIVYVRTLIILWWKIHTAYDLEMQYLHDSVKNAHMIQKCNTHSAI